MLWGWNTPMNVFVRRLYLTFCLPLNSRKLKRKDLWWDAGLRGETACERNFQALVVGGTHHRRCCSNDDMLCIGKLKRVPDCSVKCPLVHVTSARLQEYIFSSSSPSHSPSSPPHPALLIKGLNLFAFQQVTLPRENYKSVKNGNFLQNKKPSSGYLASKRRFMASANRNQIFLPS